MKTSPTPEGDVLCLWILFVFHQESHLFLMMVTTVEGDVVSHLSLKSDGMMNDCFSDITDMMMRDWNDEFEMKQQCRSITTTQVFNTQCPCECDQYDPFPEDWSIGSYSTKSIPS